MTASTPPGPSRVHPGDVVIEEADITMLSADPLPGNYGDPAFPRDSPDYSENLFWNSRPPSSGIRLVAFRLLNQVTASVALCRDLRPGPPAGPGSASAPGARRIL